ncbi:MAG TPA: SUMF1/EgtB/PvdO family nonheme iron enzyme [Candidatus Binatia bacterium]
MNKPLRTIALKIVTRLISMFFQQSFFLASAVVLIVYPFWLGPIYAAADLKNGNEMVRVPGGSFLMGNSDRPEDERPQHQVNVAEFLIDRTPVTNAQFAQFMNTKGTQAADGQRWYDIDDNDARIHRRREQWTADTGFENHPVVEASWYGAVAYCAWLGKRLPTEAEWEKAARGTDGRKFPWGNEPPDRSRAHFGAGWNDLQPVGSLAKGASPYGVLDLAGNGWEWVSSAYVPYPYNRHDGREDLTRLQVRVTRGGGHDSPPEELTTTQRGRQVSRNPRGGHHNIGFRCAR